MSWRMLAWLGALVLLAIVLAEALLSPQDADERMHLVVILAAPAIVTAVLVPLLRRWVSGRASVAGAALAVGLCSLAVGTITTSAASNAMFLSSHDYRLFLVVLVLSCGIALVVGAQLTRPLADDIARLGIVAEQVAAGDLDVRTGIDRRDEVGRTARAVDSMVGALADADAERERAAAARRLLFSSIGHDLRTPLAAMRVAVESLQDGLAPDPDRYLGVIGAQIDSIDGLLDQLVEYARLESGGPGLAREAVSLTELVDEAVEALAPLAHRRAVATVVRADGPAVVDAAPGEMSRVVRNLLDNAIRHTPEGGTVTVEVAEASGVAIDVVVHDSGPGFDPEIRERAFEPFTRADGARTTHARHAGLGLAITRAIVEAHGGSVGILDGPGGHVRVQLPAARTRPAHPSPARPSPGTERHDARPHP